MWPVCLFHSFLSCFYFQLCDTYGVISTLRQVILETRGFDEGPTSSNKLSNRVFLSLDKLFNHAKRLHWVTKVSDTKTSVDDR